MKKYISLFLYFFAFSNMPSFSQTILSLKGNITDIQTQQAIPFAHVALKNARSGAISDYEGNFAIKINSQSLQDTLIVSYIGYQTQIIPLLSIFKNTNSQVIHIKLIPHNESLDTVLVASDYKLTDLILEALAQVKENYYQKETIYLEGFVKYYIHNLRTAKHLRETEARITIIRPPIDGFKNIKVLVNLARTKSPFMIITPKYTTGSIFYDCVEKDNLPSSFRKSNFKNYNYRLKGLTNYEGHTCYHLYITSPSRASRWQREVLIDTASLAITNMTMKASYEGSFKDESGSPMYRLLYRDLYDEVTWNYQEKEDKKWYLKNVTVYKRVFDKTLEDSLEVFFEYSMDKVHLSKEATNPEGILLEMMDFLEQFAVEWDHPAWLGEEKKKGKRKSKN